MPLDDLALSVQVATDRLVRRFRRGTAPGVTQRKFRPDIPGFHYYSRERLDDIH